MRELLEAEVTINDRRLTQTQARTLRVALQFARTDMQRAPKDLLAAGLLLHIDEMLALIDATEVTL